MIDPLYCKYILINWGNILLSETRLPPAFAAAGRPGEVQDSGINHHHIVIITQASNLIWGLSAAVRLLVVFTFANFILYIKDNILPSSLWHPFTLSSLQSSRHQYDQDEPGATRVLGSATHRKTAGSWTNARTRSAVATVRIFFRTNSSVKDDRENLFASEHICAGNLCEHECDSASDCIEIGHHCSYTEGYSCACQQSVCNFERDPVPTDLE